MADLAMIMANDPGVEEQIAESVTAMLEEALYDDMDYDEFHAWIDNQGDWEEWKDYAWDYAEAFVEHTPKEELTPMVFGYNEDEEAARMIAERVKEHLDHILLDHPQYMWEWTHPDMPRGEYGGEIDIPARPYWWMENTDAQREAIKGMIERSLAKNNPPRMNPLTDAQHAAAGTYAARTRDQYRRLAWTANTYGDERGEIRADAQADHYEGAAEAHRSALRGVAYPDRTEEAQARKLRESEEVLLRGRGTKNPPQELADNAARAASRAAWRWERAAFGDSDQANGWGLQGVSSYSKIVPYTPRGKGAKGENARRLAEIYEAQYGAKIPKGTKYLSARVYYGSARPVQALGAHKTLKAAKAAGEKAQGRASKQNPPRGKWIAHRTGSHAGQHLLFGPLAGDGFVVVTPYTPRSGTQAIKEEARAYAAIYEQEQGRRLPKGTRYLLIDHANGSTTAHKTLKAAKAAGAKALAKSVGARENYSKKQHDALADRYRTAEAAYLTAGQLQAQAGNEHLAQTYYEQAPELSGQQRAHFQASARPYRVALDKADAVVKRAGADLESSVRAQLGKRNPPAPDGRWTKETENTHVYPMGREYGMVVKYAPRSFGISRTIGARYESALGRKVPKGTKYISVHGWYDPPQGRVLGAHKTLKAAKAAALKDMGVQARKNKPKKKSSNGFKVQVKTSARAKPVKVALPKSAKAKKVGNKVIHRSVTYAKGKMRLLKSWTVSTLAGVGIGKYKTKAAALKRAKG